MNVSLRVRCVDFTSFEQLGSDGSIYRLEGSNAAKARSEFRTYTPQQPKKRRSKTVEIALSGSKEYDGIAGQTNHRSINHVRSSVGGTG
ncbi:hypothetical protein EYZ11_010510 [Aspergillus tanneri]|uniref:Uncharacterized protein n=1 Tax=Aspergillus tanneri TaxID=1220188 RepID=A0A4S3J548_9EURO|nr:hypothetical protein EYZ11_010510 [Aspergillus tanneri]